MVSTSNNTSTCHKQLHQLFIDKNYPLSFENTHSQMFALSLSEPKTFISHNIIHMSIVYVHRKRKTSSK